MREGRDRGEQERRFHITSFAVNKTQQKSISCWFSSTIANIEELSAQIELTDISMEWDEKRGSGD